MQQRHFSPVAAREAVHLLILRELAELRLDQAVTLKGGVNMRLFFGSVRYSEDMDLDGTPEASAAIRSGLKGIFGDRPFTQRLRALGIRGLDPGEGPNKDTETTFRYKFRILMPGGVLHPTKVEVSFRGAPENDRVAFETPDQEITRSYGLEPVKVSHYTRESATRQKIETLAERAQVQARDVFDLHVLVGSEPSDGLLKFLADNLGHETLETAHGRAFEITYEEYRGQVIEFLDPEVGLGYGLVGTWDEIRLAVASLIEQVLERQESPQ